MLVLRKYLVAGHRVSESYRVLWNAGGRRMDPRRQSMVAIQIAKNWNSFHCEEVHTDRVFEVSDGQLNCMA